MKSLRSFERTDSQREWETQNGYSLKGSKEPIDPKIKRTRRRQEEKEEGQEIKDKMIKGKETKDTCRRDWVISSSPLSLSLLQITSIIDVILAITPVSQPHILTNSCSTWQHVKECY